MLHLKKAMVLLAFFMTASMWWFCDSFLLFAVDTVTVTFVTALMGLRVSLTN